MNKNLLKNSILILILPLFVGCNVTQQTSSESQMSYSDITETVTNYRLNYNVVYTGELLNGKPNGKGTFKYRNNDTLKTNIINNQVDQTQDSEVTYYTTRDKFTGKLSLDEEYNYHLIEGIYNYGTNAKIYQGKFKDNLFDDTEGKLIFSEKSYYVGEFKKGSNIGLIGTMYFDSFANKSEGLWYFEGIMKTESSFVINQLGKGKILFGDKSYYTGDLFYDGENYFRKGYGEMDFTNCHYLAGPWGASNNEYIAYYQGEFDYEITEWIHGNGVMYYVDFDMRPSGWAKGYFSVCHQIGEYTGGEIDLKPGYTKDMEKKYLRFREDYDRYIQESAWAPKHHKYLFAGDSYMEFMNSQSDTPFSKYFGEYDAINVGCGGSTSADWLNYYEDLVKPYSPESIFMHIGGNDKLWMASFEMIEKNLVKFINMCHHDFPTLKFYIVGQWMSYTTRNNYYVTHQLNVLFEKIVSEMNNVYLINFEDLTMKDVNNFEPIDNLVSYFKEDGTHMNDKGYTLWSNRIKEYL